MWQTIGQSRILALFQQSLETNELAHAYLFVGAPHIGKMTLALDLARALNCKGDKPPCSECDPCRRISSGKHTDISIIGLESTVSSGNSKQRVEISINDIKELQRSANLPPYEGKRKVFIIDGAEDLSTEAANCLLKILEEPPPFVVMLLLTSDERRLLPTVVSRCQRIELKPLPAQEIERMLIDSYKVEKDKARLLARLSRGCLGWALTVLTDDSQLVWRSERLTEMTTLLKAGWERRFAYAARISSDRRTAEETIQLWLTWWRDVMLAKSGCEQAVTNVDHITEIKKWAQVLSIPETRGFIGSLQKAMDQIAMNANLRLVLEVLMLDMPRRR